MKSFHSFINPDRRYTLIPFWFWNDDLKEEEIKRQIADFEAHGVYGFIIHPRVGLPRDIGWMSDRMLYFMKIAIEEARRRRMLVVLYDEGVYPSGSSSGQVVAENPAYQCRCLARIELQDDEEPLLPPGANLVAVVERHQGGKIAVIDRPVDSYIRGLHYIGEGPAEDEPPAADILNPEATATFIRLVYDRYAAAFGEYFGNTILGVFTDEPGLLGRCREKDVMPGTTGILSYVNEYLGYDFTPHLPALWSDDEPDAARYRKDYHLALSKRLEETYYQPIHQWCSRHGIHLTGHPGAADDIGFERYFHIPGQDLVWRWVLPRHPSALEGAESTQGKCSSSAMIHLKRERNSNECFGAYGHGFTWEEMKGLTDWCFVRGVNLLYPHAFFYSIRGCRVDERPPDVGPHSPWWREYQAFADYCRRMSWLNTQSRHVCHVAILGLANHLPWQAAKILFQHQIDFNYLEVRHLWEDAQVDEEGIHIAGMDYKVLILDGLEHLPDHALDSLKKLAKAGRLLLWQKAPSIPYLEDTPVFQDSNELIQALRSLIPKDVTIHPHHRDIRYRHNIKEGDHYYILSNEGEDPVSFSLEVAPQGKRWWIDPFTGEKEPASHKPNITLEPNWPMILGISQE